MLSFESPLAFLWILLIPLYYILRKFGIFSSMSFPITLSDWNGSSFEYKFPFVRLAALASKFFFFVSTVLFTLALANPTLTHQEKIYTTQGTDIIFVIDTSPSMAALDIGTSNRLAAAKQAVTTITKDSTGLGFGLVAMASEAGLVVPVTMDHSIFLDQLNALSIGNFGDGTSIGIGLTTAIYHLISTNAPQKCVVLITDGENNAGSIHPLTAASLAKENNITVYSLALGTRGSVPVEYTNPETGKTYSGYLESGFDTTGLKELSAITGGICYTVEDISMLQNTLNNVAKKESVAQSYQIKTITKECYIHALIGGMIALAIAWTIRRVFMGEVI